MNSARKEVSDDNPEAFRAIQGAAAAAMSPAALSIVTTLFPQGPERARALGVWGAVAGSGSAAGVLLGGVLTQAFGWPAIFYINVPVGIVAPREPRG
jgi:MFS family permease